MRWGERSSFNGTSLAVRDEDLFCHQPPISREPRISTRPHAALRHKPLSTSVDGQPLGKAKIALCDPVVSAAHEDAGEEPESATKDSAPFLVLAGRTVSNNNSESHESPSGSRPTSARVDRDSSASVASTDSSKRAPSSMTRTDSELELIIHELRVKISQHHRSETIGSSAESHSPTAADSNRTDRKPAAPPPLAVRRHLKNPVERVQMRQTSRTELLLPSTSTVNLLQRQKSASRVVRVVHQEPSGSSSSESASQPEQICLEAEKLPQSVNTYMHRDAQAMRLVPRRVAKGATNQYRLIQSNQDPNTSTRRQPRKAPVPTVSLLREPAQRIDSLEIRGPRHHFISTENDDTDDGEEFPESRSPVGPWMRMALEIDDSDGLAGSSSTLSLSCEDMASLSPRSRLLWFSEAGDDTVSATEIMRLHSDRSAQTLIRASSASRRPQTSSQQRVRSGSAAGGSDGAKLKLSSAKAKRRPMSGQCKGPMQ